MNKDILEKINFELGRFTIDSEDYIGVLYYNIFHEQFGQYYVYFNEDNKLSWSNPYDDVDLNKAIGPNIDIWAVVQYLHKHIDSEKGVFIPISNMKYLLIYSYDKLNIVLQIDFNDIKDYNTFLCAYTNDIRRAFKLMQVWISKFNERNDKTKFGITTISSSGELYTSWYDYNKDILINIKDNYNDDLPYDKLCELIESNDNSAFIMLYGEAGTGKSTMIKHLISKYKDIDFVFIDGNLLASIQQQNLMKYFMKNDHAVFILEDCEKALISRDNYDNPIMSVLLNITDGVIADALGIKLICTFNTDFNKIDKALIRKGRLSLKYKFDKLDKKKVKKLLSDDTIDTDMTLADIYYYKEENDFSKKQHKNIGF